MNIFFVANGIRKVGRNAWQGNDRLRNKLLNPSNGGALAPPPPTRSESSVEAFRSVGL